MTTQYDSEREALECGLAYCGYGTKAEINRILKRAEVRKTKVNTPLALFMRPEEASKLERDAKSWTLKNKDGVKVSLVVAQFRDGYDLTIVNPETGMGVRT